MDQDEICSEMWRTQDRERQIEQERRNREKAGVHLEKRSKASKLGYQSASKDSMGGLHGHKKLVIVNNGYN